MPSPTKQPLHLATSDLESFTTHLESSRRILAILGAGLSASSGLPTFRGAGGLWRSYDATYLATPGAFRSDPGLNVDGLSPRACHAESQLKLLHGSLFDVRCEDGSCGYVRRDDCSDPISPALAIPENEASIAAQSNAGPALALQAAVAKRAALMKAVDISNAEVPLPSIPRDSLPHCPKCKTSLLRPGVVWFGETLPDSVLSDIDAYFNEVDLESTAEPQKPKDEGSSYLQTKKIDLCLVIGTSSKVYPAAGYASAARSKGARVAVVNMDRADARDLQEGDWFFEGDAAEIVPEILKSVVGEGKHA